MTQMLETASIGLKQLKHIFSIPGGTIGKDQPANAGDTGDARLIPGLRGYPGGRYGNPLQYSCLKNSRARGAWPATVHRVAKVRHGLATEQQQH